MKPFRYSLISAVLLSVTACSSSSTPQGSTSESGGDGTETTGKSGTGTENVGPQTSDTSKSMDAGKVKPTGDASTAVASGDARTAAASDASTTAATGDASTAETAIDAAVPDAAAPATVADASSPGDATDAATQGAGDDAATSTPADDAFQACTRTLKKPCAFDDKQTACGSVKTAAIPLTSGGTAGPVEIPAGPYGFFAEWNQGKAFANTPSASEGSCEAIAGLFGEPDSTTQDSLNLRGADLSLYTVFRPACMKDGETYPVITWGNGTCGQTGGYAPLLATLASHGFVVFASNSRFTQGGNNEMLRALDFAKAANQDSTSVFYKRLDLSKIGAMGHSQGAGATADAASDPRVKAIILWNGGSTGNPAKTFLAVSGDRDIGTPTVASYTSYVNGATQPGAFVFFHKVLVTGGSVTGHLTLMEQPERTTDVTVAWWKYILNGDAQAKTMFVGTDCGLCNSKADFEYGQHNLK